MKKLNQWMLAAILFLCGTMTFTSCSDDNDNNSDNPDHGGGSGSDISAWIYEEYMNPTIKPGDNFYLFCNGGYWNNTVLGTEGDLIAGYQQDEYEIYKERLTAGWSYPSITKFLEDAASNNPPEAQAAANAMVDEAVNRLSNTQNEEELWTTVAQLWKEGYGVPFDLVLFQKGGKICCSFQILGGDDEEEEGDDETPTESMAKFLRQHPLVVANMRPLSDLRTRSLDAEEWLIMDIFRKELDIDPELVYALPAFQSSETLEEINNAWKTVLSLPFEELRAEMIEAVNNDRIIFDEEALKQAQESDPNLTWMNLANKQLKYFNYEKSKYYADHVLTPEMTTRTLGYLEELREAFRQRVANNTWMSDASKAAVIEKLEAMRLYASKPDTWIEEGLPNLSGTSGLFEDLQRLRLSRLALQQKLIGMGKDEAALHYAAAFTEESINFSILNAFYDPNYNSFFIFPAWMAEPFYSSSYDDAVNYATFAIFAHEMTHGFDSEGIFYDKDGMYREGGLWATPADAAEYQRRTLMLVDCYKKLAVLPDELPGLYNDGEFTLAENIADVGGFEIAFDAFVSKKQKEGKSGDKLIEEKRHFYQAFANLWRSKYNASYAKTQTVGSPVEEKDNHSLSKERVNGVVSNTNAWYDLFYVKEGQELYLAPEKRALIW